jgi:hypothetical protein
MMYCYRQIQALDPLEQFCTLPLHAFIAADVILAYKPHAVKFLVLVYWGFNFVVYLTFRIIT